MKISENSFRFHATRAQIQLRVSSVEISILNWEGESNLKIPLVGVAWEKAS